MRNVSEVYRECTALPATTTVSGVGFSPRNITEIMNLVTALADTGCVKIADVTGSSSGSAASSSATSESKNAAVARPTGVAAGAVAAVGFMGAVALL